MPVRLESNETARERGFLRCIEELAVEIHRFNNFGFGWRLAMRIQKIVSAWVASFFVIAGFSAYAGEMVCVSDYETRGGVQVEVMDCKYFRDNNLAESLVWIALHMWWDSYSNVDMGPWPNYGRLTRYDATSCADAAEKSTSMNSFTTKVRFKGCIDWSEVAWNAMMPVVDEMTEYFRENSACIIGVEAASAVTIVGALRFATRKSILRSIDEFINSTDDRTIREALEFVSDKQANRITIGAMISGLGAVALYNWEEEVCSYLEQVDWEALLIEYGNAQRDGRLRGFYY